MGRETMKCYKDGLSNTTALPLSMPELLERVASKTIITIEQYDSDDKLISKLVKTYKGLQRASKIEKTIWEERR